MENQKTLRGPELTMIISFLMHWSFMTAEQKICANTGSFTVPRDIEGNPVLLGRVKGTFNPSPRCGFSHQKYTDKNHVDRLCKNMTDDDRALLVLYSSKQESSKASSTSVLIGKKRKEATATETRAYQKQFHKAKLLECKSWLDNEVLESTHARFMSGTGSPVAGSLP